MEVLLDALSLRIRGGHETAGRQLLLVARESRARKRTLFSTIGPTLADGAVLVAGAPLAAGPPREPLRLASPAPCSVRLSERTDLALSTRLASRRSTGTSSESWPEPLAVPFHQCSSGLQRTLLRRLLHPCEPTVSCLGAGRGPTLPDLPPADQQRARILEWRPHAIRQVLITAPDEAQASRAARSEALPLPHRVQKQQRQACELLSMRLSSGEDVWRPRWRGLPSRPPGDVASLPLCRERRSEARDLPARQTGECGPALAGLDHCRGPPRPASIAPRVAVGPGVSLLAGSALDGAQHPLPPDDDVDLGDGCPALLCRAV